MKTTHEIDILNEYINNNYFLLDKLLNHLRTELKHTKIEGVDLID